MLLLLLMLMMMTLLLLFFLYFRDFLSSAFTFLLKVSALMVWWWWTRWKLRFFCGGNFSVYGRVTQSSSPFLQDAFLLFRNILWKINNDILNVTKILHLLPEFFVFVVFFFFEIFLCLLFRKYFFGFFLIVGVFHLVQSFWRPIIFCILLNKFFLFSSFC